MTPHPIFLERREQGRAVDARFRRPSTALRDWLPIARRFFFASQSRGYPQQRGDSAELVQLGQPARANLRVLLALAEIARGDR